MSVLGVHWNPAKSRRYEVQYQEDGTNEWKPSGQGVLVREWCRIINLAPNHSYRVQVRSTDLPNNALGKWSSEAKGTTLREARTPLWSDLVMADNGREIDVTRVQMLFFALIAAGSVATRLFNSYEIPIVPDGFLWLMGQRCLPVGKVRSGVIRLPLRSETSPGSCLDEGRSVIGLRRPQYNNGRISGIGLFP